MATPPAPPKKVFVSGCFDLIHSGHVEFFNEAAKFGQLYVRLGTDANILALKGHHTMYNDAERLFMVQNLKSVHDVAMSIGTGRYDYIEDMKVVRPDIYICGDDAGGDALAAMLNDAIDRKAARKSWPKGKADADAPLAGISTLADKLSTSRLPYVRL